MQRNVVRIEAGMSERSAGREAYDEKRKAYEEKRKAYDEKRKEDNEKRDDYDEIRKDYDEKSKIDRKDYQIFLGYYRNNDYIVTGKRSTRLCLRGFAKHESYIYLYKRN